MLRQRLLQIAINAFGVSLGRNWDFLCAHARIEKYGYMSIRYFLVRSGVVTEIHPAMGDQGLYRQTLFEERRSFADEYDVPEWKEALILLRGKDQECSYRTSESGDEGWEKLFTFPQSNLRTRLTEVFDYIDPE